MSATQPNPRPERPTGVGERIPYLRATGDPQPRPNRTPAPERPDRPSLKAVMGGRANNAQPAGSGLPARRPAVATPLEDASPKGQPAPSARPRFLGIGLPLWLALVASLGFFVAVRYYLHVKGSSGAAVGSEVALLSTQMPTAPIPAGQLWLRWTEVEDAEEYQLHVVDAHGRPVVDPLTVYGTTWNPPDDLLPGLVDGPYTWTVEAVDGDGAVLARSIPGQFTIGR